MKQETIELLAKITVDGIRPPFTISPSGVLLFTKGGSLIMEFPSKEEGREVMLELTKEFIRMEQIVGKG